MFYPGLEEIKELSKKYNTIPVSMEIYADMETPISIFKRFESSKYCFLLESVEGGEKWARFSFIGRNPSLIFKSVDGKSTVEDRDGNIRNIEGNPIEALQEVIGAFKGMKEAGLPRFNGGAVGYFGYDLIRYCEELPNVPEDDLHLPDSHFMIADEVIAFDHLEQKIHIIVNLHIDGNIERAYYSTIERIKAIHKEILNGRWKISENTKYNYNIQKSETNFTSNISKEEYCSNVLKAKEYIRNGDIFQVVLSQRLSTKLESEPFDIYRALRVINPSPYMYYLKFDQYQIIGSSPEMLARVENGIVETCPIAGTKKRGSTPQEDAELEKELLSDEKELAEHTMLVDLGRNDIGKVSKFGSVVVKDPMHIEKYSHVIHLVTNVQGTLDEKKTNFDALMAILPAGTLSGAPKIRAMEIIDELETVKRGPYGGAIGYISFDGSLDSCITIRTIVCKDKTAYVQAGAGIVADSVPEKEYEESLNKSRALLKALEEAKYIR
ncbi:MAG: anthranilate synthase component I [Bacillota bacterium]|nr:anthranilate synthase component I [Bacillota bacterium]